MRRLQKFGSILLVLALCLTMLPVTAGAEEPEAADGWDSRADTGWYSDNEYEFTISTAAELAGLAQLVNGGTDFSDKTITLAADIDLAGREWTPIGTGWVDFSRRITFNGTFDGGGRTISGLYINSTNDVQGLFGYVGEEGTVKNVTVAGSVTGGTDVGGVVGCNDGTVTGCCNTGSVTGNQDVGGVVGNSYSTVKYCYNTGNVNGSNYVGGVVGWGASGSYSYNTVCYSYNTGNVSGGTNVGSVMGYLGTSSTITNCYYLTGTADSGVGSGTSSAEEKTADEFAQTGVGSVPEALNTAAGGEPIWEMDARLRRPILIANPEGVTLSGDGLSEDTAFQIPDLPTLTYFRDLINKGETYTVEGSEGSHSYASACYVLTKDIDMNPGYTYYPETDTWTEDSSGDEVTNKSVLQNWTPIGASDNKFTGTFDGGGRTISGLYINKDVTSGTGSVYLGLFGYVGEGTVKELTVTGSVIGCDNRSGTFNYYYAGGIVGACDKGGDIVNCMADVTVTGNSNGTRTVVGGIVGKNSGEVTGCISKGAVSAKGTGTGNVTANAGGIAGESSYGSIINCCNTGSVIGDSCAGGIAGNSSSSEVTNCYNTGEVSGSGTVGGVVGECSFGNISNCYNTGSVSGSGIVGGVIGLNYDRLPTTVSNCYYLTGTADKGVGNNPGIGEGAGVKSNAEFASGEVAWLLQGVQTSQVWGQTLGVGGDCFPVLLCFDPTAKQVFKAAFLNGNEEFAAGYANSGGTVNLPGGVPTGSGAFLGWFGAETGGTEVTGPITVTGNATYYARFGESASTGGSGEPSYSPVLDVGNGGTVRVNPRTPGAGDDVTITVEPDQGYEVEEVTVTDRNGDEVEVIDNGDGTFTFEQPRGRVTISVAFRERSAPLPFTDVPEDYWAADAIAWAYTNGYMNGVSAGTFLPGGTISRQQVWMILARLSGENPANMAAARTWAMGNGISDGTTPGGAVTRQQLAALLYRFARLMGYDTTQGGMAIWEFPDVGDISGYAEAAMDWAVSAGIINGTSQGTLNPQGQATRAQFAVMLMRLCRLNRA